MAEILAGYTSARSLSEAERRLLLPVVVLHHGVRFALGYQAAVEGGDERDEELRKRVERAASVCARL